MFWLDLILFFGLRRLARAEERRAAIEWQALLDAERALFAASPRCFDPSAEPFAAAPVDLTADMEVDGGMVDVTPRPSCWNRSRPLIADARERLLPPA